MNYQLVKQVRENNPLRKSFIDLAVKTFDLSFEEWYQQGYWTDAYIPYAFVERNKVIANASANIIDLRWQGEPRRYIQIGTVMTEPDHRNKGLAGQLIHHILQDWQQGGGRLLFIRQSHHGGFLPQIWLHPQRRVSIYYAGLPASR
ncbi:putative GNAT-family acetyltransferase [Klebsiella pneumoniae]|uniref:Putative GNAT-family acetyltransferase n=1 Tax=Klebsiella pneumoniae TaxID=573 RepID=A0A377ZG06_KLEPN|nr:putative GNAT-family acetyltransferase [Klebsiella pneumoniae]